jgi:hypothetical protein
MIQVVYHHHGEETKEAIVEQKPVVKMIDPAHLTNGSNKTYESEEAKSKRL